MHKTAFVDDQLAARTFHSDDVVRKSGQRGLLLSPYVGRVLFSNTETGQVEVQWPWGVEREAATELIKDTSGHFAAPEFDQGLQTWESTRHEDSKDSAKADAKFRKSIAARIIEGYENHTLPLWRAACEAWHCGMSEVETFVRMSSVFGPEFGTDAVRLTVSNLFEHGRRVSIYWTNGKRRYKVTQREKDSKRLACPRCRGLLKPRVYRQGRRVLSCKSCGFTIHPKDLA